MGIQRWDYGDERMHPSSDGDYVRFAHYEAEVAKLRAELAAKSKDADDLQAVVTSIQEYATSLEYTGKWANADDDDSCRHKVAREIQELMGEGNGR